MKKNIFKLVSCMLATTMLLTGCNGDVASIKLANNAPSTAKTITVATENFNMSDYLVYDNSYMNLLYSTSVVDLMALYGQNVYNSENFYVFKKVTKDFKNNVIEDFTVYDAKSNTVVKTLKNEYFDGNYGVKDEFGNVKKAPKTLDVSIVKRQGVNLIKVVEKINEKIDDEIIEKESLDASYATLTKTTYFDCAGKEIITTNLPIKLDSTTISADQVKIIFGNVVAIFDKETQVLVDKWNTYKTFKASLYDYQNDKHGFYLGNNYNQRVVFEVYDVNNGTFITRYYSEPEYAMSNAIVLKDGNVLVQKVKFTNEYDYDIKQDDIYYKLDTVLVDPATGKSDKVEGCEYVFTNKLDANDLKAYGLEFTSKKIDVLKGSKIVNKEYSENEEWVFLDGLKIVGTYDGKVLPNQAVDFVVPKKVSNTLYTVEINDPAYSAYTSALLDKNNNVITYLKGSDKVISGYIYTDTGIYTDDLKVKAEYNELLPNLSIVDYVGKYAILSYQYNGESSLVFITSDYAEGQYEMKINYSIVECASNYVLVYNENRGYVLYNAEMNTLLTSENPMNIKSFGDNLVVETTNYGKKAIYFFSANGGAL